MGLAIERFCGQWFYSRTDSVLLSSEKVDFEFLFKSRRHFVFKSHANFSLLVWHAQKINKHSTEVSQISVYWLRNAQKINKHRTAKSAKKDSAK